MKFESGSHNLPFVRAEGRKITDYWAPQPQTGDWADDNQIGREYADELVGCPTDEIPLLLNYAIEQMVRKGRYEGIEVGFVNRIAEITSHVRNTQRQVLSKAA